MSFLAYETLKCSKLATKNLVTTFLGSIIAGESCDKNSGKACGYEQVFHNSQILRACAERRAQAEGATLS